MDTEAWSAVIHGVTKSRTRLSDRTELNWILESKNWMSLFVDNIIFYIENPIESTKKVTELFFMSLINVQDVRLMNKISYRSIPYPNDEK